MTQPATPQEPVQELDQDHLWEGESDSNGAATTSDKRPSPEGRVGRAARSGAWNRSLTASVALPGPAGLWYAEVPDRVIAFVLDVIALAVVGILLAIVVGGVFGGLGTGDARVGGSIDAGAGDLNVGAFLVVGIVALAVSFTYFTYSWVVLRSTPGMRMLGLRIGDQIDGHAISWDQALVRWLLMGVAATLLTFVVYVPSLVGMLSALLGLVWLVIVLVSVTRSPTKQGLHDRYARTILVRAARRAS